MVSLSRFLLPPGCLSSKTLVVDANRKLTCAVSSFVTELSSAQIGKSITNHTPKSLRDTSALSLFLTHSLTPTHKHIPASCSHTVPQPFTNTNQTQWFHLTRVCAVLHSSDAPIINTVCVLVHECV